jgi:hypothetical protein
LSEPALRASWSTTIDCLRDVMPSLRRCCADAPTVRRLRNSSAATSLVVAPVATTRAMLALAGSAHSGTPRTDPRVGRLHCPRREPRSTLRFPSPNRTRLHVCVPVGQRRLPRRVAAGQLGSPLRPAPAAPNQRSRTTPGRQHAPIPARPARISRESDRALGPAPAARSLALRLDQALTLRRMSFAPRRSPPRYVRA